MDKDFYEKVKNILERNYGEILERGGIIESFEHDGEGYTVRAHGFDTYSHYQLDVRGDNSENKTRIYFEVPAPWVTIWKVYGYENGFESGKLVYESEFNPDGYENEHSNEELVCESEPNLEGTERGEAKMRQFKNKEELDEFLEKCCNEWFDLLHPDFDVENYNAFADDKLIEPPTEYLVGKLVMHGYTNLNDLTADKSEYQIGWGWKDITIYKNN